MSTVSTENAEHYIWGSLCDGWHLAKSPNLSVIQERVPPNSSKVRHYHQKSEQFFRILMYYSYTAVLRAVLPCSHKKITIFRGAHMF
ncbi:cupin domain-containing protein [Zooshikella harenae]|uniref:Uncharacterized protein n=1 Tax=Zooshikella harenae TaxID=2827238 RepID=A0ABS5ZI64_9GAMM|nr:hypothetical protein [Zooshikella harenae]MBU2713548.1 hypothetical protein [Zooshikella harenae]